ncbi:hypothetical protein PHK61_13440 [Actinomycetospora lutea]|uniref:hypothetical protein n=1 Tax=Actinomycetospora lutea TaxID=663604 RepID=UPI0023654A34|nr:hypothetical protein [Actinomycetospora lutea]MDD7939423.1 hypothetical protein [Actinomycetospora lutea]
MSSTATLERPTATTASAIAVTGRDRAVLAAIAAGRVAVAPGAGFALVVDGCCCADQFAGARLRAAGLIRGASCGSPDLTPAGRALLTGV